MQLLSLFDVVLQQSVVVRDDYSIRIRTDEAACSKSHRITTVRSDRSWASFVRVRAYTTLLIFLFARDHDTRLFVSDDEVLGLQTLTNLASAVAVLLCPLLFEEGLILGEASDLVFLLLVLLVQLGKLLSELSVLDFDGTDLLVTRLELLLYLCLHLRR